MNKNWNPCANLCSAIPVGTYFMIVAIKKHDNTSRNVTACLTELFSFSSTFFLLELPLSDFTVFDVLTAACFALDETLLLLSDCRDLNMASAESGFPGELLGENCVLQKLLLQTQVTMDFFRTLWVWQPFPDLYKSIGKGDLPAAGGLRQSRDFRTGKRPEIINFWCK